MDAFDASEQLGRDGIVGVALLVADDARRIEIRVGDEARLQSHPSAERRRNEEPVHSHYVAGGTLPRPFSACVDLAADSAD